MHNGVCAKDEPIKINVYCEVKQEEPSDPVVNGNNGPAWINTVYSVDKEVPVDFFIREWIDYSDGSNGNGWGGTNDITIYENTTIPVRENNDYIETVREDTVGYTSLMRFGGYRLINGSVGLSLDINEHGKTTIEVNGQKYEINKHECTKSTKYRDNNGGISLSPECGSAHNTVRTTQPSGSMLCSGDSVASPVSPTDSGWEWSCTLESGGYEVAAECSARKLQNITIKCDTNYYDGSEFVGGRVGGCRQIMWKSTTYTATAPVPTDIYIEQEKHQYGISSRDSNSCQFCFHPADTAVTPYIIRANQRTSTKQGGGWISAINRRGLNGGGIGFDSYLMNGDSSISFNGVGNDYPGNISTVNHYLEYTGSNGVEYHITLADCDNVYENWINSTSTEYIKPMGQVCSRGSNPSDPNPGGGGGGGGSSQVITLNNMTQRYIRLTNNTEYPFHFTDTSAYETDCIGSTEVCDLYLQPGQQDFAITYDYCNDSTSFYAQSCRFGPDDRCGTLYQIPISCSTSIIDLDQSSASTR